MRVTFESVRSDWYASNSLLPRLIGNAILKNQPLELVGFPAQWIPVCIHYGIAFSDCTRPSTPIPFFSDLLPKRIEAVTRRAHSVGRDRSLLESVCALDSVIADLVYIVDHRLAKGGVCRSTARGAPLLLNTWHSFGQPEVVDAQAKMAAHKVDADGVVLMPCSKKRPYSASRTHSKLRQQVAGLDSLPAKHCFVVVTALGVIPESYWSDDLVLTYDAGAVDLWRVYSLLRVFFSINQPAIVVDCLSFRPYSDMIATLMGLGKIASLIRPFPQRWRSFSLDLV